MRNNTKSLKIIGSIIIVIPFIMGFFGFLIAYQDNYIIDDTDPFQVNRDYTIEHALFDSFGQYFFNRDTGGHLNWLITISEFMAPLCLVSGLLLFIGGFTRRLADQIISRFCKGVIAVYGDHEGAIALVDESKTVLYREDHPLKKAAKHIVYFKDETDGLEFLQKYREHLGEGDVHVVLDMVDPFAFAENFEEKAGSGSHHVYYVNLNEQLARRFWLDHPLMKYYNGEEMKVKIAIIGGDELAVKILNYGLMLNGYRPNQSIQYHVWGDYDQHKYFYVDLADNIKDGDVKDTLEYHEGNKEEDIHKLKEMDRIILGRECDRDFVQRVLSICHDAEVFFWDPGETALEDLWGERVVGYGSRHTFGAGELLREAEHASAKNLNARYEIVYRDKIAFARDSNQWNAWVEEKWKGLSPFERESNEVAVDYHVLREMLMKRDEELGVEITDQYLTDMCMLEHMRWCRFHYLNAWGKGAGPDGNKDTVHRLHPHLTPYESLKEAEKGKDLEAIATLIYDPALRQEGSVVEQMSNKRRNELILALARKKFGAEASVWWQKWQQAGKDFSEDDPLWVAFTMYDIRGIAFLEKGRELLGNSMQAVVWGYDPGLGDVLSSEKSVGTVFHFNASPEENELEKFNVVIRLEQYNDLLP